MRERIKTQIETIKKEFNKILKKQGKDKIITYLYLIFSLIAITIFGIFAINPTLDTISDLHREKEDSEHTLEQLREKNQALQSLNSQYNQIENDLDLVYSAIPTSPRIPELTRKIEILANRNNLAIENLTTGAIELFPATRTTSPLFSFTISITAVGTENDVNNFIQDFINFDRIIRIDRITSGGSQQDLFSTSITGRAFFIKE